jgi:hypothetical protein
MICQVVIFFTVSQSSSWRSQFSRSSHPLHYAGSADPAACIHLEHECLLISHTLVMRPSTEKTIARNSAAITALPLLLLMKGSDVFELAIADRQVRRTGQYLVTRG